MSGTLIINRLARSSSISDGIFDFSGNLLLDAFVVLALGVNAADVTTSPAPVGADVPAASSDDELP